MFDTSGILTFEALSDHAAITTPIVKKMTAMTFILGYRFPHR
jgi:hypothetical protein